MRRKALRLTVAILAVLAALKLSHLGAALTEDEAFMLRTYADQPARYIVSHYEAPNNHILLSLLVHAIDRACRTSRILTLASPWPLQLPSALAAAAALPLLFDLGVLLAGPGAGLAAAAALGVSFWHSVYAHMIRAYSLSALLTLLCAWLVAQAFLRGRRAWLWALPPAMAASCWLVPTNALFMAAIGLWACWLAWRRARRAAALAVPAAAGAAAAALTLLAYAPVLAQLRRTGSGSAEGVSVAGRAGELLAALGHGWPARLAFGGALALGLASLWRRGSERGRAAAVLVALSLGVPFAAATLLRQVPPARVYVAALPLWFLAVGAGARELWRRRRGAPAKLALAALAAACASELWSFARWQAGLDARGAMAQVVALTRDEDDFVAVAAPLGEDQIAGALDWDYYGHSARVEPWVYLMQGHDYPYLARSDYLFLALSEGAAAEAARRSGLDDYLIGRLKKVASSGRIGIYRVSLDDQAAAHYAEAAKAAAPEPGALAMLAHAEYRRGRLSGMIEALRRARGLAPADERVRYMLGEALYLGFQDAEAEKELAWVVAHDSANVHAPYFLAETLLQLGRPQEALDWYRWYGVPGRPPGVRSHIERARIAAQALASGAGPVAFDAGSPEAWDRMARLYAARGAYERAAVALTNAVNRKPDVDRFFRLAQLHALVHDYALAASLLGQTAKATHRADIALALAQELSLKGRNAEALALLDDVLGAQPSYEAALTLRAKLARLP